MVERIIEYSARNRFIVFLLVFSFSAVGLWAM
jgi:copper/silver efflux system protein